MNHLRTSSKMVLGVGFVVATLFLLISVAAAQTCLPPPAGMVSWWPGDGDANDIQDGNDGTLVNGATFATGEVGQAFSFNGNGQYVSIPAQVYSLQAGTVDFWVNWDGNLGSDQSDVFIGTGASSTSSNRSPTFFVRASGEIMYELGDVVLQTTGVMLVPNTWYHLAMTYTQTGSSHNFNVYVNGVLTNSGTATGITDFVDTILIGAYFVFSDNRIEQFTQGRIDELEIFDRALTTAEIQAIFNAGSAGKCKEPELSIAKVTGGGQITPNGGGRASFGFTAQREEDGSVSGHLNYLDRDADLHINGPVDEVTASAPTGPVTFSGTACDGTCTFTVTVEDHGEPGKTDTFEITVAGSVTYSASPPTISRGNIQRHF